jgi:NADH dehydrogenase
MTSATGTRVVVVGAGFGGLSTAHALARDPVEVTVVDRDNYHGFWPLLYQVATSGLAPDDIASPIRGLIGRQGNARVRLGTVSSVDLERRRVFLDDGGELPYDYLVLAAGSATTDFGIPGVAEHAFPLKTIPDAVRLRNHVLSVFEQAAAASEPPGGALTIVLAGGGPTGVEMAGALSELISKTLRPDFQDLDLGQAKVVLVEMVDHLLGGFSAASQREALRTLREKGVDVRLGVELQAVDDEGVTFADGSRLATRTVVWTAGIKANPLAATLPGHKGKGGSVVVEPDLSLPGHPEVFVIGDMAAAAGKHGDPLPELAQVAIQGARHTAKCIRRRLSGAPTRPFRYRNHGIMATIGRSDAVAELPGGVAFHGFLGWLVWLGVHLVFLVGFRNRVVVMFNWAWNYLTWNWGSRVIISENSLTPFGDKRA